MAVGCPVVSFCGCDGGDKVGSYARQDMDDYFVFLEELSQQPVYRETIGAALQQRFTERLDLAFSGQSLSAALELARQLASQRLLKLEKDSRHD